MGKPTASFMLKTINKTNMVDDNQWDPLKYRLLTLDRHIHVKNILMISYVSFEVHKVVFISKA